MPPVKTGESPRLVKILARHLVGSRKRRTLLYRCEWDDDTWSWESSKALEEDPDLGGSSCMVKMRPKLPLHGTAKK